MHGFYLWHYKFSRHVDSLTWQNKFPYMRPNILSCASEVGSPTNHLGSRQQWDTGQGSSSLLTGGLNLTPTEHCMYAKYLDIVNLVINYQKLKKKTQTNYWTRQEWMVINSWTRFIRAGRACHNILLHDSSRVPLQIYMTARSNGFPHMTSKGFSNLTANVGRHLVMSSLTK